MQYVEEGALRSVIFIFMRTNCGCDAPPVNILTWGSPRFLFTLLPKGLAPATLYAANGSPAQRSGESLMNVGLDVELEGDGDSLLVRIEAVKGNGIPAA